MSKSNMEHLPLPSRRMVELLVALEKDRGWSQTRSGKIIGLSQGAVSFIATGVQKKISANAIAAAQDKLGLDPHYFFDHVLRGDGTYNAYLRRSDVEREAPPVAPPANSNTAPRYTEDHEIPTWAQRRREREAAASAPPVPVDSSIPTAHSQDYLTPKGLREREEREAAEKLAKKKSPARRR